MVGPWQVPVADCASPWPTYQGLRGEAMAMGERTPLASLDAPASGRMAVAEAITNLLAAPIELSRVKLSCQLDGRLRRAGRGRGAVRHRRAVGMELCPALGIGIPVGKDSLSMRTRWSDAGAARQVTAPVSLVVTAFATLDDVRGSLTPQLQPGDTTLIAGRPGPGPHAPGRVDAGPGAGPLRPPGARP
jgi:phosphoribosylformylglycinamidine synthase